MSKLSWATNIVAFLGTACLTILSLYSWFRSSYLSLPTPRLALFLSTILPFGNLFGLRYFLADLQNGVYSLSPEILGLISIADTILVTLASAELRPEALSCGLEKQWQSLFAHKDAGRIRRIQDSLNCCGLRTTHDRAWPFPTQEGANACERTLGRHHSCFKPWESQEKTLLAIMIAIGGLSVLSKILVVVLGRHTSWLRWFSDQGSETRRLIGARRTQEQLSQEPYQDDPEAGTEGAMSRSNPFATGDEEQVRHQPEWSA